MDANNYHFYGCSIINIALIIVILGLFKKKIFGIFDPLSIFIIFRVSSLFGSILIFTDYFITEKYIIFILSSILFISALYYYTKNIKYLIKNKNIYDVDINLYKCILYSLITFKLIIILYIWPDLPIFNANGSNSYIEFNEKYKIISTLLLGIGSLDLLLASFITPQINKNRYIYIFLLILTILFSIMNGKKSSIFNVILSIALSEYIRVQYTKYKSYYFLKKKFILPGIFISIAWAIYILLKTETSLELYNYFNISNIIIILDNFFYQFIMPYDLFLSGSLDEFFKTYQVNRVIYLLHTALSPFGIRSFDLSIGPAINEYLSGTQNGTGINPTFILEGTVLFGLYGLPAYAFLLGLILGKLRNALLSPIHSRLKFLYIFLFMPYLYSIGTDLLFFMKIVFVSAVMIITIYSVFKFKNIKLL